MEDYNVRLQESVRQLTEERDAALGRVEMLELRLNSGVVLVNAVLMGLKSAGPKLAAWAESEDE